MRERHIRQTKCRIAVRRDGMGWQETPADVALLSGNRITAAGRKYQLAEVRPNDVRFVWEFEGRIVPSGQLVMQAADWRRLQEATP